METINIYEYFILYTPYILIFQNVVVIVVEYIIYKLIFPNVVVIALVYMPTTVELYLFRKGSCTGPPL